LGKLCEEDPTSNFHIEPETHQTLLFGMGDVQLDMALSKLKKNSRGGGNAGMPRVLYKETIQKIASGHHKHGNKPAAMANMAMSTWTFAPVPRGEGYRFEDHIVGGVIPKSYLPGVEKGVSRPWIAGVLAGYPVIDVLVKVVDGSLPRRGFLGNVL